MSSQPNPHDAVFRRILGEPVNAASQLRAMLPAALTDRLELDRLEPVSGSFVDATLRWRHSDLLFTAPLDGRDAFVYVLVEHQSSEDPLMAFRMLRYVMRIWDGYLRERPHANRLPAVIPLVVHHNHRAWLGPMDVFDLIDIDSEVADTAREHLPRFRFLLDDLARVDEHALRNRPVRAQVRLTLFLLKTAAGNAKLADELHEWADELREVLSGPGGIDDIVALLTYIETVGEAPAGELHELFARLGPEAEEAYVTTADMLRSEGRAEGRAEALRQQLVLKFGPLPQDVLDRLDTATTHQLETWTARILTATTLDETLR